MRKESSTSTITLIKDENQLIRFNAQKYFQGKDNNLYGSPYTITVGIPVHENNSTTAKQVEQQKNLIRLHANRDITPNDIFSSANFLTVMLNHGSKGEYLAWNEGHRKLLLSLDKNSKVVRHM